MSRPGRVVQVAGGMAEVESGDRCAWFNALMVPEARVGDWVLTHTGLVVSVIDEAEAAATARLIREVTELETESR
jgi:hydrogenase expression/formation protein HypC